MDIKHCWDNDSEPVTLIHLEWFLCLSIGSSPLLKLPVVTIEWKNNRSVGYEADDMGGDW